MKQVFTIHSPQFFTATIYGFRPALTKVPEEYKYSSAKFYYDGPIAIGLEC